MIRQEVRPGRRIKACPGGGPGDHGAIHSRAVAYIGGDNSRRRGGLCPLRYAAAAGRFA